MKEFYVTTRYVYKCNTVSISHRNMDTLMEFIDDAQTFGEKYRGAASFIKAKKEYLDVLIEKMKGGTMTDDEHLNWAFYVNMLSFLKEIPSDDSNGTMTCVNIK